MLPIYINIHNLRVIQAAYPNEEGLFADDLVELVKTCRRLVKRVDSRSDYVLRYTDDQCMSTIAVPSLIHILSDQVRYGK